MLLYAKVWHKYSIFCIKIEYYKIVTAFYSTKAILQDFILHVAFFGQNVKKIHRLL